MNQGMKDGLPLGGPSLSYFCWIKLHDAPVTGQDAALPKTLAAVAGVPFGTGAGRDGRGLRVAGIIVRS